MTKEEWTMFACINYRTQDRTTQVQNPETIRARASRDINYWFKKLKLEELTPSGDYEVVFVPEDEDDEPKVVPKKSSTKSEKH